MSKRHHGSSVDSFLKEDSSFEELPALAIKEVVVWQLIDAMEKGDMSKARLALLKTGRSQAARLLDLTPDVTLSTGRSEVRHSHRHGIPRVSRCRR